MKIFVTGDLHSDVIGRFSYRHHPELKKLGSDDVMIVLGDFGVPFGMQAPYYNQKYKKYDLAQLDFLRSKPWTTLVITGNHEDYDYIETLPEELLDDRIVARPCLFNGEWYEKIYFIDSTQAFIIGDKKILAIPGPTSTDTYDGIIRTTGKTTKQIAQERRQMRKENKTYFRQEHFDYFSQEDVDITPAFNFIDKDIHFDYILSHDSPSQFDREAQTGYNPIERQKRLGKLFDELDFDTWLFGHRHMNWSTRINGKGLKCIFNDIQEM